MSKVDERALEISDELAEKLALSVVDVEFKKEGQDKILRVYIDKDGGVDLDDCEKFSRALEEILDEEDFIDEAYNLEVSSPGLDRQLKKEREFLHYLGREVEVKLYKEQNGLKEFCGVLKNFEDKTASVEVDGKIIKINPKDAAFIKLYFEF